jgi:hypothetical protein
MIMQEQQMRPSENVARDETHDLIAADKVEGTSVYNRSGDHLGTVDEVMIGKRSGKVAYAVMSFGGFLGIGERYHPLPWNVLTYDESKGGYVIDLGEEQLRAAPTFTREELDPRLGRRDELDRLHTFYGVPPHI